MVCSEDNRNCMLRVCNTYPSFKVVEEFLMSKFEEFDSEERVEVKQWMTTNRTDLVMQTLSRGGLIETITAKLTKLIPHSHIAK